MDDELVVQLAVRVAKLRTTLARIRDSARDYDVDPLDARGAIAAMANNALSEDAALAVGDADEA